MQIMVLVQWPAMLAILIASWLVGSKRLARPKTAFLVFILGNLLWIAWGTYVAGLSLFK